MKLRISKNSLKQYPPQVAQKIQTVGKDFNIKSFTPISWNKEFIVGEGERYFGIGPNGEEAGFEVQAEHNIGAAGLSKAINSRFRMPEGSYLIVVGYYGGYYMTVYEIPRLAFSIEKIKGLDWKLEGDKKEIERIKKLLTAGI